MSIKFSMKRSTRPAPTQQELYRKGVYPPEFNNEFKASIRKRDGYRCTLCLQTEGQLGHSLDIHHINYTKYTVRVNCISLCRECHELVHSRRDAAFRAEWAGKLYRIACQRERLRTRQDYVDAWRSLSHAR